MSRSAAARPSRTAQSVAVAMVLAAHDPSLAWLVPPDAVAPIRACLREMPGLLGVGYRSMEHPFWLRRLREQAERRLPGGVLHLATRKAWIEREVRRALAGGATQVVVIGAGFDSLAYRLHRERADVAWWEVDRAATQRVKLAGLGRCGAPGPTLGFVAADLGAEQLPDLMERASGYSRTRPTVFIAEGLTMYLTEAEATTLFRSAAELLEGGGRLLGTALAPEPDGSLRVTGAPSWLNRHLRRLGEPFQFGIAPEALPEFAVRAGFAHTEVVRVPAALRALAPGRPATPVPDLGEYLFALRADHDAA
ncbi:MAG: class I SAM-dependent methyltransferase [Gemmatimonadales bacterium]